MKIYIIGICGTFMGGVARLAVDLGHDVCGSDANTYPPMSTQLESLGITLYEGYDSSNIAQDADIIIVGNTISRGNPELEAVLEKGLKYTSGAQWLSEHVLQGRWVLAVSGTHGKTTTASILAWLLQDNQLEPGYLIGGVPENFGESARLGTTPFFVIEADEYDTAFSDKRSKFIHYHPRTLIINNLEFDHADIFNDLAAIQAQFHHLIKTIPENGLIIHNDSSQAIDDVIDQGCWSETKSFSQENTSDWQCEKISADASQFKVIHGEQVFDVAWPLIGDHNMHNALAAIAAAHHVGVPIECSAKSLSSFKSVKRRLEKIYNDQNVSIYDDFAHHPTAIRETVNSLRSTAAQDTILAILEPRSNTMKRGVHKHLLADALAASNCCYIYADENVEWDINALNSDNILTFDDTENLIKHVFNDLTKLDKHCHILIMSNGGFENLHQRLIDKLK